MRSIGLFSPRVGDFDSRWANTFALSFFWLAYWPKEIFFPGADFVAPLVKVPDPTVALVFPLGVAVAALLSSLQMLLLLVVVVVAFMIVVVVVVGWDSTRSGLSGMFAMSGLSSIVVYTLQ
ncbi:hypothetical protein BGX38DRAFT_1170297 [Terfezia claveryi]|nr:hypothetical protein BGX38DRAFT_1170297 [Terfezia claveryi]